jgi:hypothetical protein
MEIMAVNSSLLRCFCGKTLPGLVVLFIFTGVFVLPRIVSAGDKIDLLLGRSVYQIELAATLEQRRQGLMFRQQLDPKQGMLLVYPGAGDHRIWMKNMRIDLRVYWIDDKFTVISVQRLESCRSSPCPVFSAPRAARFILELGDYDHDLSPGDTIEGLGEL